MAQEPALLNMSLEQKERWKKLTVSLEDPVLAVKLFNSNGVNEKLRKDFSFLMAFAALVKRMGADKIDERARSWMNLMQQKKRVSRKAPDPIQMVYTDVRVFIMQFIMPTCVGYHLARVDFVATIESVVEYGEETAKNFIQVLGPLLHHGNPFQMISYMYNNWILSGLANKETVGTIHDLFLDVPQELKDWAHNSDFITEDAMTRLSAHAHHIPADDAFFNRLIAGLCAYACFALLHVVRAREMLMEQDGVNWDATEETIPLLNAARKRQKRYDENSIETRLQREFQRLLVSCKQDLYLQRTKYLDEAKMWAKKGLDLTDAEWNHIWSLVGINTTSTTMHRGQFVIGTFMAEKYSMLASESGFPIEGVRLTEHLAQGLKNYMNGCVRVVNLLE